jgi:hypothetical protein
VQPNALLADVQEDNSTLLRLGLLDTSAEAGEVLAKR